MDNTVLGPRAQYPTLDASADERHMLAVEAIFDRYRNDLEVIDPTRLFDFYSDDFC